jgi:hypothetical protein
LTEHHTLCLLTACRISCPRFSKKALFDRQALMDILSGGLYGDCPNSFHFALFESPRRSALLETDQPTFAKSLG